MWSYQGKTLPGLMHVLSIPGDSADLQHVHQVTVVKTNESCRIGVSEWVRVRRVLDNLLLKRPAQ